MSCHSSHAQGAASQVLGQIAIVHDSTGGSCALSKLGGRNPEPAEQQVSTRQPPKIGSAPSMFWRRPETQRADVYCSSQCEPVLAASRAPCAARPWLWHLCKDRKASFPKPPGQNKVLNPGHSKLLTQAQSSGLPCCMPCPAKYCLKTTKLLLCGVYSDSPGNQEEGKH